MSKTTKPVSKPTSNKGDIKSDLPVDKGAGARQDFLIAAANMSWQLAIVVLAPVIGGFKLDEALNTTPVLTIVGFILAMVGMAAVVWRQLQIFSPNIPPAKTKAIKGHR